MAWRFPQFLNSRKKPAARSDNGDNGYFPLQEPYGSDWDANDYDDDYDDDNDYDYDRDYDAESVGDSGRQGDDGIYRSGKPNPAYDAWDAQLDQIDRRVADKDRLHQRWWQPRYWRQRRKRWWLVRSIAAMIALFFIIVAWLLITAPLSKSLEPIAPPQITLLAADGTPIARNGAITAEPVKLDALPDHVAEAFLAIEDRRFFTHWGVDPRGIARAAWTGVGGGSTITQQLAKNSFLTPERSLTRKAREALIAFWLEAWLTKEEILERYLSNVYFGDNVYGLRAASLHYFYRKPENLQPQQAAMLAGLVQAPSRFAPTRHYDRAEKRMKLVLKSMVAAGYLTQAEADAMPRPVIDSRAKNDLPTGTYFADWALPEIRKLADGGYASQTFTTTLDSRLQGIARRAIGRARLGKAQVALVAMRPNGEVVAMIGGTDYSTSPFNRATQAQRQPGSTFKLFVYLAALEAGMLPSDTIDNSEITAGSYRPKNYGGRYSPTITLEDAFAQSSNVAAVRLFQQMSDEAVINTARDLGITSPLPIGDPSVALGSSTVSLLELTAAYAGIAGNRFPVIPHAYQEEEPGWFDWLWSSKGSLSGATHDHIQTLLRAAVNRGTGRAAMLSVPNYGKTGTTQNNRDALFIGYAGEGDNQLVVGVWIGNDDNTPLAGVSGGGLPARVWRDFMSQAIGAPVKKRPAPKANPAGPVQPQDALELEDIPLDENGSTLSISEGEGVTISTELGGAPVELRLDEDGVNVTSGN